MSSPLLAVGNSSKILPVAPVAVGALLFDGLNDLTTMGPMNGLNPSKWQLDSDTNNVESSLTMLSTVLDPLGSGQRVAAFALSSDYSKGIQISSEPNEFTPPILIEYQTYYVTIDNWNSLGWVVTGNSPPGGYEEWDCSEPGGQDYGENGCTYHWDSSNSGTSIGGTWTDGYHAYAIERPASGTGRFWWDTTDVSDHAIMNSPVSPLHLLMTTGQLCTSSPSYGCGPTGIQGYCRSARVWELA